MGKKKKKSSKPQMKELQEKISKGKIRILKNSTMKTELYSEQVDNILDALGHPEALITDESKFNDFLAFMDEQEKEARLKQLSNLLQIEITIKDYIADIAEKLARREIN